MDPDLLTLEDWEKAGIGAFTVGVLRDLFKQRYRSEDNSSTNVR